MAVQRGASNFYFPVTQSALSIPPWTSRLPDMFGTYWNDVTNIFPSEKRSDWIETTTATKELASELGMSSTELADAVAVWMKQVDEAEVSDLRPAEYRQFVSGVGEVSDNTADFEVRREPILPVLKPWLSNLVRAVRLREVRALTGFTRLHPPGDPKSTHIAALSRGVLDWLPAIEVRGEGVFLALDEVEVRAWETRLEVKQRCEPVVSRYLADWRRERGPDMPPPVPLSARYILCHTLSHVLMRQMTLECGYSASSLQERIFVAEGENPMSGLLIYTSTSDSDGTLGGLQRQGTAARMAATLPAAIRSVHWCSSDPLCISDMMDAQATYSRSSCHACVLAAETSCEVFNQFLDRALLVGTPDCPELGFFADILKGQV
jgi:hypothetical protein